MQYIIMLSLEGSPELGYEALQTGDIPYSEIQKLIQDFKSPENLISQKEVRFIDAHYWIDQHADCAADGDLAVVINLELSMNAPLWGVWVPKSWREAKASHLIKANERKREATHEI